MGEKFFCIDNLISALRCPECFSENIQSVKGEYILCSECQAQFEIKGEKIYFKSLDDSDVTDWLDKIKYITKKILGDKYNLFLQIVSPVCFNQSHLYSCIDKYALSPGSGIAMNLGSGNSDISDKLYNVDIFPYENVDIVSNIMNLPFRDNSVDCIVMRSVLEHLELPEKVINEVHRVLKPEGVCYCSFPFIVGYHASPYDYTRRTKQGLKSLFSGFSIESLDNVTGPTSGFLWILQEYFAILLSFGSKKIYKVLLLLLMVLTFPVKFLDVVLRHHPMADNISSSFAVVAKKNGDDL